LGAYFSLLAIFTMIETARIRNLRALPQFLVLFPTCHIAYAVGLIWQCALSTLTASDVKPSSEVEPS
jgi:hypothetical protein